MESHFLLDVFISLRQSGHVGVGFIENGNDEPLAGILRRSCGLDPLAQQLDCPDHGLLGARDFEGRQEQPRNRVLDEEILGPKLGHAFS